MYLCWLKILLFESAQNSFLSLHRIASGVSRDCLSLLSCCICFWLSRCQDDIYPLPCCCMRYSPAYGVYDCLIAWISCVASYVCLLLSCLSTIHAARLYPVLNLINCCLASIRTCSSFSMLYGHIRRQTLRLLAYAWMSTYCFCAWICLNVMSNYCCLQKHWAHRILKYIICLINTVSSWIFLLVHLLHLSDECSVLISSR